MSIVSVNSSGNQATNGVATSQPTITASLGSGNGSSTVAWSVTSNATHSVAAATFLAPPGDCALMKMVRNYPAPKPPGTAAPKTPEEEATFNAENMRYQRELQAYNRMLDMVSRIFDMQHQAAKSIISNFRS